MTKRIRQYIGIFAAVAAYYLVHEGAHLIAALHFGFFRQLRFLGLGMQVEIYAEQMTRMQLGLFCLAGAVATLLCGWILAAVAERVCRSSIKIFKAAVWYITLAMLMLDPVYLSILSPFFGGGDMNGICLLVPQWAARIAFGTIGVIHGLVIWKILLPRYAKTFQKE